MKFSKVNIKVIRQAVSKTATAVSKLIQGLKRNVAPVIKIVWRNKLALISAVNAIVSAFLVIILAYKLVGLAKGNNYWWSIGEQSGISSANRFDYLRSIAQNNIPVVFVMLMFTILLLTQTVGIFGRARSEKWDKKNQHRWARQFGLLVYLVIVIALTKLFVD